MRRALGAAGLVVLLVAASACGDGSARTGPAAPSASASSPSGPASPSTDPTSAGPAGSTASPVLDPAHVEDPPGPRTGAIAPPDLVVTGQGTFDDATVAAVRRLPGVVDVEPISLAQVVIENEVVDVAAVDAASYRLLTPLASAETQAVWDRVAGGELALRPGLRRKLPQEDGRLRLGTAQDAASVHVGAYAPQVAQVDAVVNETWIDTLDMQRHNTLLVRTGTAAPSGLRAPLEALLGGRAGASASVQLVDAVARFGLDPDATQTALLVGTVADAVGVFTYTVLGGGRIAPDPAWVREHIATETVPILGRVTCNRRMLPQLKAALAEVVARGLADEIHPDEYAGCYYPRFIAGTTTLSNHSFGLALDLNTPGNQRGTVGEMDRTVVSIFEKWGFAWGGDWRWTDPMHFEMSALVEPR